MAGRGGAWTAIWLAARQWGCRAGRDPSRIRTAAHNVALCGGRWDRASAVRWSQASECPGRPCRRPVPDFHLPLGSSGAFCGAHPQVAVVKNGVLADPLVYPRVPGHMTGDPFREANRRHYWQADRSATTPTTGSGAVEASGRRGRVYSMLTLLMAILVACFARGG